MSDTRALQGIRILDFTQVLAGPFATQQLAQLGADVIKIEEPVSGDITRGLMSSGTDGMAPSFLTCNLGKRSLTLDLKHPRAREVIERLVKTCDAVVENFKPGTIERLGFGYEALKAIKPDIVYCSISGYGQSGPMAPFPAFDGAIQASSGMMSISGHPETGPSRTGYFSVDMSTALNAAFAITAALFRRLVTGEGQRVDVAMMDTAVMMQAAQFTAYLQNGTLPELYGNASPTKQPAANVFATTNGFVQVIALRERHVEALFALLGHPEMYATNNEPLARLKNTAGLSAFLKEAFAANTSEHWISMLQEAGIPVAPVRTLDEVAVDPQFDHRLTFANNIVSASHVTHPAPPEVQRPPPRLGEHNKEILLEVGYSAEEIAGLPMGSDHSK